ncbi:MAG TPA: hypothetical protein VK802_04850 [Streptosporangiaceae bacterium]|jgi:hypothetical protein|nr:hypothetical protein [Streptosporangiaceae bacterium]
MIRTDRLSSVARERGAHLAAAGAERLASALRGRKKSMIYVGAALALAGAGSATAASAATVGGSAAARPATVAVSASRTTRVTAQGGGASRGTASNGAASQQPHVLNWAQVRGAINQQTNPVLARHGILPPWDQLMPVATSGPQVWMPLSPAQMANATTIVGQALDKRMGVRAAVIAVATAMQESQLQNLSYGDQDSLGLFQQRPSMGWGTAAQITDPAFASDAFLSALHQYQAGNPAWASEPLWANAQAVQKSGFPLAYARWEAQAANLVKQIAMHLQ